MTASPRIGADSSCPALGQYCNPDLSTFPVRGCGPDEDLSSNLLKVHEGMGFRHGMSWDAGWGGKN